MIIMKTNAKLEADNAARLSYKLINDLFYFDDSERGMRLYILIKTLKQKVFKLAHNEMRYSGYAHIHEKLTRGIYIFNMFIKLHKYLRHYSYCQLY